MRLGTLAKDLNKKLIELEDLLKEEFSIENDKGPNFKLDQAHLDFIYSKFPKIAEELVVEEKTIAPSSQELNQEEEFEIEIIDLDKDKENLPPKKIDLSQIEKKETPKPAKPRKEVYHNRIAEEPIENYQAKNQEEEQAIKDLETRIDKSGVIRAPKVEPLKGIVVQGKIEIPTPLTQEEKEAKKLAKLIEDGKVELDENGEPINYYKPKQKTKEERAAAQQKRKEQKLQKELKAIERKKKNEEKAKKQKAKAKREKEKEARKQHYIDQMNKQKEKVAKNQQISKTANAKPKTKKKAKTIEYKPSTGLFGWFWRLLDPK